MLIKETLKELKEALYPSICEVCDEFISETNRANPLNKICKSCLPELYFKKENIYAKHFDICPNCLEIKKTTACLLCDFYPLPFNKLYSLWPYSEKTEKIISLFKYRGKFFLSSEITKILTEAFFDSKSDFKLQKNYDFIIPAPSQNLTIKERGFHHTSLIAKKLAKSIPGAKVLPFALYYSKPGKRQALKELSQRKKERKLAISLNVRPEVIRGKKILFVDDVLTTGATAESSGRLLRKHSNDLDFLSISRSENFLKNRLSE